MWLGGTAAERPLRLANVQLMGSAARGTLMKPVSDVDVMVMFQENDAALHAYTPTTLLKAIDEALTGVGNRTTIWKGQAVTVHFPNGGTIDVFPCIRFRSEPVAKFPREGKVWYNSYPPAIDKKFLTSNYSRGRRLVTVARYLKAWNVNFGKPLASFHLESLVEAHIAEIRHPTRASLYHFFRNAAQTGPTFLSLPSPDGIYSDMSFYLSAEVAQGSIRLLSLSAQVSEFARILEGKEDFSSAAWCWRLLLGVRFPAQRPADSSPLKELELALTSIRNELEAAKIPDEIPTDLTTEEGDTFPEYGRARVTERCAIVLPPGFILSHNRKSGESNLKPETIVPYAKRLREAGRSEDAKILLQQTVPAFRAVLGPSDHRTVEAVDLLQAIG
jgi:hypothetical protein